jgi:hypothetical protein
MHSYMYVLDVMKLACLFPRIGDRAELEDARDRQRGRRVAAEGLNGVGRQRSI